MTTLPAPCDNDRDPVAELVAELAGRPVSLAELEIARARAAARWKAPTAP